MSDTLAQQLFKGSGTALIIRGIAAVLFGILVVVWPGVSVLALVILFGILLIASGAGLRRLGESRDTRLSMG